MSEQRDATGERSLVEQLRSRAWEDRQHRELRSRAADRIEELERELHATNLLLAAAEHTVLSAPSEIARPCTCHPDDNPPVPCPKKYALTECREAALSATRLKKEEQVEWVVNDIAELGVKIGDQFFWLYKGTSLVYGGYEDSEQKDGVCLHDNGGPMHWRPVGKREFGECCHPVNYKEPEKWGTVSLDDSDEWKPLPVSAVKYD